MVEQPGNTDLANEPTTGKFVEAFKEIYGAIQEYHQKLGYPVINPHIPCQLEQHRDLCLAMHAEVTELLESVPWKPWRDSSYKRVDKVNMAEEIIDILFFCNSICELWYIDHNDLAKMLERKLVENNRRISMGYNWR